MSDVYTLNGAYAGNIFDEIGSGLFFYDDPPPADPPKDPPAPPKEEDPPSEDPPPKGKQKTGDDDKPTLTQAEADKLASKVRKEGKDVGRKEVLAELEAAGFSSIEEFKKFADDREARRKEELSDNEKLEEELATLKADKTALETANDEKLKKANNRLIRSAAMVEMSKPDYKINPSAINDVWKLLESEQMETIKYDEDADKVTGLDEAIKNVLKERDYLITKGAGPGTTGVGRRNSNLDTKDTPKPKRRSRSRL